MKSDKKLWLAIGVLAGLIIWLIILSFQRGNQLNNVIQAVQNNTNSKPKIIYGINGRTPIKGIDYVDGSSGSNGLSVRGSTGATGGTLPPIQPQAALNGTTGPSGASAYDLWLGVGNTGTIDDFLNSIHGQDGAPGAPAREREWRCNPITGQEESRLIGDSLWQPMYKVLGCL